MRKRIFRLAILLFATTVTTQTVAQVPDRSERIDDLEAMLERRRWGEARVALDRFRSELNPVVDMHDLEWVEYHKMRCAVELGAADAEIMMDNFISQYPSSVYRPNVIFMMACKACDKGEHDVARDLFLDVDYKGLSSLEKERYDIRVGYLSFLEGDNITALYHLKRVPKISEYYPHALYYRAYIAYKENRNSEATALFTELEEYDVYRDLAPYYLLQMDYRQQNYAEVISEGERLLKMASTETYADLVRIIAESYFVKGDYANAIRYITHYPSEKYGRQENYIRGYSLYRMARYSDAVEPLRRVCGAKDALTQNAAYHLGDCYLRLGDKQHSADAFGMASESGFDEKIAENAMLNYCRLK